MRLACLILLVCSVVVVASRVEKDSTDVTEYYHLRDSSTNADKTGLTSSSSGLAMAYVRDRTAAVNVPPVDVNATDAHSDGGFVAVDETLAPGLYRVDFPDAAFAAGSDKVQLVVQATGAHTIARRIELYTETADANGRVDVGYINGLSPMTQGDVNDSVSAELNVYDFAADCNTSLDARLNISSGVVESNVKQLDGSAVQQTSGHIHAYDDEGNAIASESLVQAVNDVVRSDIAGLNNLSQAEAQTAAESAIDGKFNLSAGVLESNVKQLDGSAVQQTSGHIHAYDDEGNAIVAESLAQDFNDVLYAAIKDVNTTAGEKTGYFLDPNGLMYLKTDDPNDTPSYWDFRDWLMWGVLEKASRMEMPVVNNVGEIKIFTKDGQTVITTQDVNECSDEFKRTSILE